MGIRLDEWVLKHPGQVVLTVVSGSVHTPSYLYTQILDLMYVRLVSFHTVHNLSEVFLSFVDRRCFGV